VSRPLHFIGHSFGTVVNSEAIQRLGVLAGVTVDHMTTLDPHDWDQSFLAADGGALLPDVHVWSNVQIADNYYSEIGGGSGTPKGRPLAGAGINGGLDLSNFEDFYNGSAPNPHSNVWAFYYGTIDSSAIGTKVDGQLIRAGW
jgi:hypothetical protein